MLQLADHIQLDGNSSTGVAMCVCARVCDPRDQCSLAGAGIYNVIAIGPCGSCNPSIHLEPRVS